MDAPVGLLLAEAVRQVHLYFDGRGRRMPSDPAAAAARLDHPESELRVKGPSARMRQLLLVWVAALEVEAGRVVHAVAKRPRKPPPEMGACRWNRELLACRVSRRQAAPENGPVRVVWRP